MTTPNARIWEIDFLRGLAILLMISFHIVFDLAYFWNYDLTYQSGFWYWEGKLAACLFLAVSGISTTLRPFRARRGLNILTWGLLLTGATWLYAPASYIRFGILHLIGSCLLLTAFFNRLGTRRLALLATLLLAAGAWTATIKADIPLLLPFGIRPAGFLTLDYYPLLPWGAFFLYGILIGQLAYGAHGSRLPRRAILQPLAKLGRHALVIYLLHQPVLLAVLFFLHK